MNAKEFRAELVKIMPGYDWTVHKPASDYLEATGIQTSGSNRLSTLSVVRLEREGQSPRYAVKSSGYGRQPTWLHTNVDGTLARALRGLQNHYESTANTYHRHAEDMRRGREAKSAPIQAEVRA